MGSLEPSPPKTKLPDDIQSKRVVFFKAADERVLLIERTNQIVEDFGVILRE